MTVHERPVGATVEWYTPPSLFYALGLTFDLDPAASFLAAYVPARQFIVPPDDGLAMEWSGRVWLNPPSGRQLPAFVDRMCEHHDGIMLTASRTETRWWQKAAQSADLVCFLRDRLHFIRGDGLQVRSSFASTLFAWGADCGDAVCRADLGWTVIGANLNQPLDHALHYDPSCEECVYLARPRSLADLATPDPRVERLEAALDPMKVKDAVMRLPTHDHIFDDTPYLRRLDVLNLVDDLALALLRSPQERSYGNPYETVSQERSGE